jgi:hypothetical protein
MARYLVSGIAEFVSDVAAALREHAGVEVVEVVDIADVARACTAAGPAGFDGYVQLPASFDVRGDTAVDRVHHFFAEGVLARFPAVRAVLPVLIGDARITFVMGVLPPEVSTDDDVAARSALVRVLAHAARADRPEGLRVSVIGSGSSARDIALTAMGRSPEWEALAAGPSNGSYADWRVEVLGMLRAEM